MIYKLYFCKSGRLNCFQVLVQLGLKQDIEISMSNNTTLIVPYVLQRLCSFDGVAREQNSAFKELHFSLSVIVAVMSPVAVAGNALILITVWKNPSLRTASYIILCGLAFTDLCTGLITQPFFAAVQFICLEVPQNIKHYAPFLIFAKVIAEGCGTYFTALTVLVMTFMSIERWLHMARRSLVTVRRVYLVTPGLLLLLLPVPLAVLRTINVLKGTQGSLLNIISFTLLLFCLLATSVAYFKVFRIVRLHQQQVQSSQLSQDFGRPAINMVKYKKSVFSILYIVALFYISYLPFLIFLGLAGLFKNHSVVELAFTVTNIFFLFVVITKSCYIPL